MGSSSWRWNDLGLAKAVDRLCQSVVVVVTDTANRGVGPDFGDAFGVLHRHVSRSTIAMMDQAAPMSRAAIVKRLLQSVDDDAGRRRPAGLPADDRPNLDNNLVPAPVLTTPPAGGRGAQMPLTASAPA